MKLRNLIVMPRLVNNINEWYWFPLGIAYVSSSMKHAGFEVITVNLNHKIGDIADVLRAYIKEYNIDVLLTGGLTGQYSELKKILLAAKEVKPEIITIVGGGIITSAPAASMEALELVDYGIVGEGEASTCELCMALEEGGNINTINGLIYRDGVGYHQTDARKENENLDQIDFPDYEGFDYDKLMNTMASHWNLYGQQTGVMIANRSCPFQCTFCFRSSGSKYRQRSMDGIFEEIDFLVKRFGIRNLFLSDELFSYNLERIKEFCTRIKSYGIKWWAQFRVSDVTDEMVRIIKDANCVMMAYGLESADNGILKSMHKHITLEQIENALEITSKYKMGYLGGFIFGDKEETLRTASNTLNWWKNHDYKSINLAPIITYPGTPLYKYACEQGIITDEVQFIKDGCPIINVSKMSDVEFGWIMAQIKILTDQKKMIGSIENKTFDYINGSVSLVGHCGHCKQENSWDNILLFRVTGHGVYCKKCNGYNELPLFDEVIDNVHKNIMQLLTKYKKIAIWGMGQRIQELLEKSGVMRNESVFLVDDAKVKQDQFIGDKLIHKPNIVIMEEIGCVVVYVPFHFEAIEAKIQSEFQTVKKIISVVDLIDPDYIN